MDWPQSNGNRVRVARYDRNDTLLTGEEAAKYDTFNTWGFSSDYQLEDNLPKINTPEETKYSEVKEPDLIFRYVVDAYKIYNTIQQYNPIPNPDVVTGISGPPGGVEVTIPFGSGGSIKVEELSPSWNLPVLPTYGVNLEVNLKVDSTIEDMRSGSTLSTPIGGLNYSIGLNGNAEWNFESPKWNFPIAPEAGVNAYIGIQW